VHYPFRQPKILSFGDYNAGKLGLDKTEGQTEEPMIVDSMHDPVVEICSVENYTIMVDDSGKLWKTGEKETMGGKDTSFRAVDIAKVAADDKDRKPEEEKDKIVKIGAGINNVVFLTKKGKIYIEGNDNGNHIKDGSAKHNFESKKLPSDDDKVIDLSVGRDYHLIVTEKGKLYGAGNNFLKENLNIECGINYANIPLEKGALAKRVWCTHTDKDTNVAFV